MNRHTIMSVRLSGIEPSHDKLSRDKPNQTARRPLLLPKNWQRIKTNHPLETLKSRQRLRQHPHNHYLSLQVVQNPWSQALSTTTPRQGHKEAPIQIPFQPEYPNIIYVSDISDGYRTIVG